MDYPYEIQRWLKNSDLYAPWGIAALFQYWETEVPRALWGQELDHEWTDLLLATVEDRLVHYTLEH